MTYSTRAEAVRDARVHIWGDVPFARRAFIGRGFDPDGWVVYTHGIPYIVVAADVNGHLVAITFDHYGRRLGVAVLPR